MNNYYGSELNIDPNGIIWTIYSGSRLDIARIYLAMFPGETSKLKRILRETVFLPDSFIAGDYVLGFPEEYSNNVQFGTIIPAAYPVAPEIQESINIFNPHYMAIDGDGYFILESPTKSALKSSNYYTKIGGFYIGDDGQLYTFHNPPLILKCML
jgi:flagellar hook protein FlgE